MENITGLMEIFMKDSGKTINSMEKDSKNLQTEGNTKVIGLKAVCTEEAITAGPTDNNTRANTT